MAFAAFAVMPFALAEDGPPLGVAHEEGLKRVENTISTEDFSKSDSNRQIEVGDLFNLKLSVDAILLEHDDDQIFNQKDGGLKGQVIEVLANTKAEAAAQCRFTSDITKAQVLKRTKPCKYGQLIVVRGFVGSNKAPRLSTCLCTSATNLQSQPYLVMTHAESQDDPGNQDHEPIDSPTAEFLSDEEEPIPTDENFDELYNPASISDEEDEIEVEVYTGEPDNGDEPEAILEKPRIIPPGVHGGFVPAEELTIYRPNGTFAGGTENLVLEIIQQKPITGSDKVPYYLGRLWKIENNQYVPFKHELIYGVPASEVKLHQIPPSDQNIPKDAEVFAGPFTGPPRSSTRIDTQLAKVKKHSAASKRLGYYTFNDSDGYLWGRPQIIWTVEETAKRLVKKGITIGVNDINRQGSKSSPSYMETPDHTTHDQGKAVDLRVIFNTGMAEQGTPLSEGYSKEKTLQMIKEFVDVNPDVAVVYFNDAWVRAELKKYFKAKKIKAKVEWYAGHDNHVHIGWRN